VSVAVVIPLFNGARWIDATLESVLKQEEPPAEIVVLDDGSTDVSPERARRTPGVHLLHNPQKGSLAARNFGLAHTTAAFVAFLDHDDLWHPAHLRLLRELLERNPRAPAAVASAQHFWNTEPELCTALRSEEPLDVWETFPFTCSVPTPSAVLLRRSALLAAGSWDANFAGMGDIELWLRLCTRHPFVKTQACTVAKRRHADSQWLKTRAHTIEYLDFRLRVMRAALARRLAERPAPAFQARFGKRLSALVAVRELAAAILAEDKAMLDTSVEQLEIALFDEPADYLRRPFYCLVSALCAIGDRAGYLKARDALLTRLTGTWPTVAPRTRAAIDAVIEDPPW